jgi:hypothetical protein
VIKIISYKPYGEDRCPKGCCFHGSFPDDFKMTRSLGEDEAAEYIGYLNFLKSKSDPTEWQHYVVYDNGDVLKPSDELEAKAAAFQAKIQLACDHSEAIEEDERRYKQKQDSEAVTALIQRLAEEGHFDAVDKNQRLGPDSEDKPQDQVL